MTRWLEIRALRFALSLCLRVGIFADWMAPRITQRLKERTSNDD